MKRNHPFYLTAMLLSRVTSKINSDRNDMATCGVVELSKSQLSSINCFNETIVHRSILKVQHPPPGDLRAFDYCLYPWGGEFKPCPAGVENLNRKS